MSDPLVVAGRCPACGGSSLFLGSGGYVTCSRSDCPVPDAAASILEDGETQHIVELRARDFTIRHPLIERLGDALMTCTLHTRLAELDGPPHRPGRPAGDRPPHP